MGKALKLNCPRCGSDKVVRNGHYHNGKSQFFCHSCHKYFYENPAKGYPSTSIPFPVIAYLLYFRRRVPGFSNMRSFRHFVNYWLIYLRVSKGEVSRQTVHHWIDRFDPLLDKVISFDEASNYCHVLLKDLTKVRPPISPIPYGRTLRFLERKFGKPALVRLLKEDEVFFKELVNVVGKHGVFCWEFDDKKSCIGLK
jgi:hypothetical protein